MLVLARSTQQQAADLLTAVDRALGLPADPAHRGRRCPPAPFGRTETWSKIEPDGPGRYVIDAPPARVDGAVETVRGVPITIDLSEAEQRQTGAAAAPAGALTGRT